MRRILFTLLISYILCTSIEAKDSIQIPAGWRKPIHESFKMEWRKQSPTHYLEAIGDYNDDGKLDYAYILEPCNKEGIDVFVFLSQPNRNLYKPYKLRLFNTPEENPDVINSYRLWYGIQTVPPGKYLTSCGKKSNICGGWGAEVDEVITFKNDAIDFFHYDAGGDRFFYWNEKTGSFKFVWMSD